MGYNHGLVVLGAKEAGVPINRILTRVRGAKPLNREVAKRFLASSINTLNQANKFDKPSFFKQLFTSETTEGAQNRRNLMADRIKVLGYLVDQAPAEVPEPLATEVREIAVNALIEMNSVAERVKSEEANTALRSLIDVYNDAVEGTSRLIEKAAQFVSPTSSSPSSPSAPSSRPAFPGPQAPAEPSKESSDRRPYYVGGALLLLGLGAVGYHMSKR